MITTKTLLLWLQNRFLLLELLLSLFPGLRFGHLDASPRRIVTVSQELVRCLEFLNSRQIGDTAVICFEGGILLPSLTVAESLAELNVFEKDKVSDAKFVPRQILLVAQIIDKLLHVTEAVVGRVRLVFFHEAELHEGDEVIASDTLQLIVASPLLRRLAKQFWLELLGDVLVHGEGL